MLTQVPAEQKSFLTFNGFFTNINVHCSEDSLYFPIEVKTHSLPWFEDVGLN